MIITLTESELRMAGIQALERRVQALTFGRCGSYGVGQDNALDLDFQGCQGEIALCKATDRFWSGKLGDLKADDGAGLQVRATYNQNGNLILHKWNEATRTGDRDEDVFVLVRLAGACADIRGWIRGALGKQDCYWAPDGTFGPTWRKAYRVPAAHLQPFPEEFVRPDLRAALIAMEIS